MASGVEGGPSVRECPALSGTLKSARSAFIIRQASGSLLPRQVALALQLNSSFPASLLPGRGLAYQPPVVRQQGHGPGHHERDEGQPQAVVAEPCCQGPGTQQEHRKRLQPGVAHLAGPGGADENPVQLECRYRKQDRKSGG